MARMVPMTRVLRHQFARSAHGLYPQDTLQRITQAIANAESKHRGEICFAVESSLPLRAVLASVDAQQRALDVFAQLRVWNTRANNGVLLYLLLADHRIEIVADIGLDAFVSTEQWRGVCQLIEEGLKAGEPEAAVLSGIDAVSAFLAQHFPRIEGEHDQDELPNEPHLFD